jgi:hypothetical protein
MTDFGVARARHNDCAGAGIFVSTGEHQQHKGMQSSAHIILVRLVVSYYMMGRQQYSVPRWQRSAGNGLKAQRPGMLHTES